MSRLPLSRLTESRRFQLAAAISSAAASLTPSLLPKTVLVQGIVAGLAATAGYAVGALLQWVLTPLWQRLRPTVRDRVSMALLVVAALWLAPAAWFGHMWQRELAASVGETDPPSTYAVVALLLAGVVVTAAVLAARGLRAAVRWVAGSVFRALPRWLALALSILAVTMLTTAVADQVVRNRVLASVDESFRLVNEETEAELPRPADALRSGGPGSAASWSTLGHAGREFVSLPPPPGGRQPIRVYAGIDSATSLRARADLVVAELERTGALRRGVVCVVVPTGTGWVDPAAVKALEALWAGDSAVASMQYSYLPSVLSLAIDRLRVDAAAEALVGAVVRRWLALPPASRPRLVLYGESLGARGVEVALRTVPRATEVVTGVLLAGPPNSNPTWSRLVSHRDPGTPLLAPTVDGGRSVRFWPGPEMPPRYNPTGDPWLPPSSGPRTLYLQHPSDPIVWWSPSLLWSEPAWVDDRTTVSRAPPLRWRPLVTFWQVTGDLAFSNEVPPGHGHRYGPELAAAWAAVAPRPTG
ncbi:MAG: alpha/beta hydrolase [Micromonospora sp.]